MGNRLQTKTKTAVITVASSTTVSAAIELEDLNVYGVQVPTLTSSTLKIQGSVDEGSTYGDIYDEFANQVLTYPAGTGSFCIGTKALQHLIGFSHIQFVCGSAQGANRTFTLYQRNTE